LERPETHTLAYISQLHHFSHRYNEQRGSILLHRDFMFQPGIHRGPVYTLVSTGENIGIDGQAVDLSSRAAKTITRQCTRRLFKTFLLTLFGLYNILSIISLIAVLQKNCDCPDKEKPPYCTSCQPFLQNMVNSYDKRLYEKMGQ
jgi:hypothetical protein